MDQPRGFTSTSKSQQFSFRIVISRITWSRPLATADLGRAAYFGFLDKGNVEGAKTMQICNGQVQGRKIPALAGGRSALAPTATAPTTNSAGLAGAGTSARDAKSVR
jgi:hypothetical protein